jgi:hypothetical protein
MRTLAAWGRRRCALAMVLISAPLLLAACGGGGGGAAAPAPTPVAPSDPGPASLVPAVPPLGQTLESDAGALVPQTAGANWRFWGRQYSSTGSELGRYESSYLLAQSGSEWKLSGTNPGNGGPDSLRYVLAAGQLQQIETVQFSATQVPEDVHITLLRSPVQTGDQVLAYNKRIDGIPDQDGDGRTESLDVAIYTRVIGTEKIDTALGEQIDAVRVETHVVERILFSKTGQPGPVVDIVGVDWLARGLGWVARDQPTLTSDGQLRVGKERLLGAEVGAQGYGNAAAPVTLTNPTSSPEQAGQALAMQAPRVVVNGDSVLLIGSPPVVDTSGRPLMTLLNSRGEVQWTRLGPAGARFGAPLGGGWVLWGNLDTGQVPIFRLDAQGQQLTADAQVLDLGTPQTPLPSNQRSFSVAGDSQALWVVSVRGDWIARADGSLGPQDGIVARGFDLSGTPLTAPILLERSDSSGFFRGSVSLAVRQGQAQVAWLSTNGGLPHLMLAQVSSTGVATINQPSAGALSESSPVALTATPQSLLLNWGTEGRFAWVDSALGLTVLDSTRSDGTLPALPIGASGLADSNDVARGDMLLRWNIGAATSSGALNGTSGALLQWQLYRAGQAASLRKSFVASSPNPLVVPLSDRMLVISQPLMPQRWVVEQVRY